MEEESKMGSARMELQLNIADAHRVKEECLHHLVVPQARVGTAGVAIGRELKITDQACLYVDSEVSTVSGTQSHTCWVVAHLISVPGSQDAVAGLLGSYKWQQNKERK